MQKLNDEALIDVSGGYLYTSFDVVVKIDLVTSGKWKGFYRHVKVQSIPFAGLVEYGNVWYLPFTADRAPSKM